MTYRTDVDTVEVVEPVAHAHRTTEVRRYAPNPLATVERALFFLFGLIIGLIALRIVLLLVAARQGNDLVSAIYNLSEIFVAPFRGILRIDEVQAGVTALDVGAIVAIVGWLIIEFVVIAAIRLFRPTATA